MKKNIKFLLAAFAAMVMLLSRAAAQDISSLKNATPEQRAQFQTNMMKTKLNLDAGQTAKAQDINLKYAQKFQPIIKGTDGRIAKVRQMMALQEQKDKELEVVFNKEQYKQYKDFEAEMRSKMMERAKNQ